MSRRIGVAALARPTFDVPYAEDLGAKAFVALDAAGFDMVGPRELLFDTNAAEHALAEIRAAADLDFLLLLQITFTDASMTAKLVEDTGLPAVMWAVPEPRMGGRLRLNAYCGLNLAAHALGKRGLALAHLYAAPDSPGIVETLKSLNPLDALPESAARPAPAPNGEADAARRALAALNGAKISVVGEHPLGFDTCTYDAPALKGLAGMEVETVALTDLFEAAKAADAARVESVHQDVAGALHNLKDMDAVQLDRSLRVYCGLQDLKARTGAAGMAVRCWPETFTEYGCAACAPMAMMTEAKTPCSCEADVYGTVSTLLLQEIVGEPVWMADLVDVDEETGVFWHCGLAPLSMCDPAAAPEATIHTNRKMPLLHQFPLKPGRVTIMRVSQARGAPKLVIAGGDVRQAPMAFTGTSGVVAFDAPAKTVSDAIIGEGLEHHYALAYGDHRPVLRAVAAQLHLPVLELTQPHA